MLHGELAASRPAPSRLTEYYLWVSLGGALGGAFTALIVPLVLQVHPRLHAHAGDWVPPAIRISKVGTHLSHSNGCTACTASHGCWFPRPEPGTLYTDRSFFGIYRVTLNKGPAHILYHGSTIHGAQFLDSPLGSPMTYYHLNGPVGQYSRRFSGRDTTRNVGTVGLGTGIDSLLLDVRTSTGRFSRSTGMLWRIAKNSELFSRF